MRALHAALAFLIGDPQADRMVPPAGFTVTLTVLTSAAMAFLAVFALALSLASGRLADRWGEDLAKSATIRISAPADQIEDQTRAALRVLETTPGVAEARALSDEDQRALLAPWFGPDLPVDQLPIPRLIEVVASGDGYDATGLRLRLQAEVPGAVLDDHSAWRRPLVEAAGRLRALGWLSILLIGGATGAMITLAANAALAANAQVIAVMRLVGARDSYIAGAFVRRFTLRAAGGAFAGTVLGGMVLLLLPRGGGDGATGVLTGLGLSGVQWGWTLVIPPLAAAVAFLATRAAARRSLQRLS